MTILLALSGSGGAFPVLTVFVICVVLTLLLAIWAAGSYGLGIFLAEPLGSVRLAGFPLGFWFAQQGSIITFVILIAVYVTRMDKLDAEFGVDEYEEEVHHS